LFDYKFKLIRLAAASTLLLGLEESRGPTFTYHVS